MSAIKQVLVVGALSLLVASCSDSKNASLTSPTPVAVAAPVTPSTHSISGRVSAVSRGVAWTPQTGAAVEGVLVTETNSHQSAITDAKGIFSITGVSGPLSFSVSKSGYFDRHTSTIPAGAGYMELRIDPIPTTYTLTGAVFEMTSSGRVPVEGVRIEGSTCDDPSYCKDQISTTDRNGLYSLTLYEGRNDLWVSKEGYQTDPPVLHAGDYDYNATVTLNGDTRFDIQVVRR